MDVDLGTKLEWDLSNTEITSAIRDMQSGKSLGSFQTEFFKIFSGLLSPLLLSVFEKSLTAKMIPLSVISLLP